MPSDADFDTEEGGTRRLVWEANKITGNMGSHLSQNTHERRFKANFGASLTVAYTLWCLLDVVNEGPVGGTVAHFLWTLMFLKLYDSNDVLAGRCKCDPNTFRKWVWLFLDRISAIEYLVSTPIFC